MLKWSRCQHFPQRRPSMIFYSQAARDSATRIDGKRRPHCSLLLTNAAPPAPFNHESKQAF